MQVSGASSSLYDYYAQLQAKQKSQAAGQSAAAEMFESADSDGSGGISLGEFSGLLSQAAGRTTDGVTESGSSTGTVSGTQGTPPAGSPPPGPPPSGGGVGALSEEETEQIFLAGDTDGDGELSAEELAALREQYSSPEQTHGGANASLLAQLGASASGYGEAAGGVQANASMSFADIMQNYSAGAAGSSTAFSSYMQTMIQNAYGA